MKIAIIGAGNMGGSIARGLAKGSLIADSDIIVSCYPLSVSAWRKPMNSLPGSRKYSNCSF